MGGILSSLNTSYTGLTTSQVMVDTTGHNISNANNEHYTRQRVSTSSMTPLQRQNYDVGQGTQVETIVRIHDEFVFSRYRTASEEKEFSEFEEQILEEVSTYYPEIDDVGIYRDLQNYFDAWKDFANNPGDPAQKLVLSEKTETLSQTVTDTRRRLYDLQKELHEELKVTVEEVNRLGEQIAELNSKIRIHEEQNQNSKANDLRDSRDELELAMSKLINIEVFKGKVKADSDTDTGIADFDEEHVINIAGYSIIDNSGFHPLVVDNESSPDGFYNIYYERQDYKLDDITGDITGGKAGAIIDLALGRDQNAVCTGDLGKIQNYIDDLDVFAKGLIEHTNNIFAESASEEMISDPLVDVMTTDGLAQLSGYDIRTGSFDIVMYNTAGDELAKRSIEINETTTIQDIVDQINQNADDNDDYNSLNDVDDEFVASYSLDTGVFQITQKNPAKGLTISVQDNDTNFAGAFGLSRFFDGDDAKTIDLASRFKDDPTLITAYKEPVNGDFKIANMMQQLQYDEVKFISKDGVREIGTIPDQFKKITTRVATETESVQLMTDTKTAVYESVQLEYSSVSQVNLDEELTNLMKFQTGYSANAKMITAIDQMITTLLGIKE